MRVKETIDLISNAHFTFYYMQPTFSQLKYDKLSRRRDKLKRTIDFPMPTYFIDFFAIFALDRGMYSKLA